MWSSFCLYFSKKLFLSLFHLPHFAHVLWTVGSDIRGMSRVCVCCLFYYFHSVNIARGGEALASMKHFVRWKSIRRIIPVANIKKKKTKVNSCNLNCLKTNVYITSVFASISFHLVQLAVVCVCLFVIWEKKEKIKRQWRIPLNYMNCKKKPVCASCAIVHGSLRAFSFSKIDYNNNSPKKSLLLQNILLT